MVSESARMGVVWTKSKDYTYMAAESVLAGYGRQVYKDYGILLVWENESAQEQLEKYIQDNINMADLEGGITGDKTNFMVTNLVNVKINEQEYVTDNEGEKFTDQIISYMKYAGTINAAESLVKKFNRYSEESEAETTENNDVADIVDNNSDELQKLVKKINNKITTLKETDELKEKNDAASQEFKALENDILSEANEGHDKLVKNYLKGYRELTTELEKKSGDVNSAIELIKQYETKKELFLEESGYTADAGDYIEDNLKKLENVENGIEKNKELAILDFSDINSKNIHIVTEANENIDEVINVLESLYVNRPTEEDEKNKSIYEMASSLLTEGVLSIVLEDASNISGNAISLSNLPSTTEEEKNDVSILKETENKAILSLYSGMKFGNYLKPKEETCLDYEMEYIIAGKDTDKENLAKTIEKMAAARNVVNIAYLITDKEKMSEVSVVAESAAVAIGLPFLEPVIKGVLIEAWALAEAVSDVKALLRGEKIAIIKNKSNWNTSLTNLTQSSEAKNKGDNGIDYETFLEILIIMESSHDCVYRIMDLIQVNVQKRYNTDFLMSKCFQSMDITAAFSTEPIFTAMPWTISVLNESREAYKYNINCQYSY